MRTGFWERLFPVERDFYQMLSAQAGATMANVQILERWLTSRSAAEAAQLAAQADELDAMRLNMEAQLIAAFVTPFDRQDIYSFSVEMDRIVESARSTLEEMQSFAVVADPVICSMVQELSAGTALLAQATTTLKKDPQQTQSLIGAIRKAQSSIDSHYRTGMAALLNHEDLRHALKYREVYHHIKDAGSNLGHATDVLHKIVVRIL